SWCWNLRTAAAKSSQQMRAGISSRLRCSLRKSTTVRTTMRAGKAVGARSPLRRERRPRRGSWRKSARRSARSSRSPPAGSPGRGPELSSSISARISPAGAVVRLRYAEILRSDGQIDAANLRGARATDTYTLRGDSAGESYEPHFTYHGFRYVELSGFPGKPGRNSLEGLVVHTDARQTGT